MGIDDYVIFEDDGYSAKNTDRPRYQEMMMRIRTGEFSHLIVWKVDRVSRNLLDFAAMYQELKRYKVTFISMNEQFDTSNAIGEAMLKIILIFAELERNMTSERVTGIMLDRAENGLWNGARMPVGYRWGEENKFPVPDKKETDIIHLIFDEYEKKKSCLQVMRLLEQNHVQTKRGGHWTSKLIHDIIRNPFYIGTYRYNLREAGRGPLKPENEWIIKENNHAAIISKEQFFRCNQIMDENASSRNTSELRCKKFTHTFSRKLICANCGSGMNAFKDKPRANGYRPSLYYCSKRSKTMDCESKTVSELLLGPFVFNYIANLSRIQKNFKNINSISDLEKELLKGEEFKDISGIGKNGLNETYNALVNKYIGKGYFEPNTGISDDDNGHFESEQIALLKNEREKCTKAMERLTDLYLYDPDSMTTEEFSKKKRELKLKIESFEEQLSQYNMVSPENDISDISFIKKASAFLISQRIMSKKHIDYLNMSANLDNEILKDFIDQTVDHINIKDGRISSICFINGLQHEFIYSKPAELPNM